MARCTQTARAADQDRTNAGTKCLIAQAAASQIVPVDGETGRYATRAYQARVRDHTILGIWSTQPYHVREVHFVEGATDVANAASRTPNGFKVQS